MSENVGKTILWHPMVYPHFLNFECHFWCTSCFNNPVVESFQDKDQWPSVRGATLIPTD